MYIGDIRLGETVDFKFTTRQISGAPSTLGGTPVISAYVGNGTTQITAGITLTVDFDSVTGLNNVRVVATSGNGFATATNVDLVITTGTVNSVSVVGEVIGSFSIEARSALMPTTVARTLDVSAGGEAGVDWANVGSPTTAVNLSATNIDVDQVVASVSGAVGSVIGAVGSVTGAVGSVTGAVGSVTGNVGGNVVGSVGSVTGLTAANLDVAVSTRLATAGYTAPDNTSIAAILVDTAEIGVAGAGLTNINLPNQTMDIVGNITGNLSGSVGSVTGSVGSVTGNVGGNVVGSVASVTAAVAITSNVKKNQALGKFQFLMTDSTNHAPSTGLTVTVTRSIDGAAFAAGTLSAVTEIGNGMYYVDFGSGDLNGNVITLQATAAASDTTFATIVTQP